MVPNPEIIRTQWCTAYSKSQFENYTKNNQRLIQFVNEKKKIAYQLTLGNKVI